MFTVLFDLILFNLPYYSQIIHGQFLSPLAANYLTSDDKRNHNVKKKDITSLKRLMYFSMEHINSCQNQLIRNDWNSQYLNLSEAWLMNEPNQLTMERMIDPNQKSGKSKAKERITFLSTDNNFQLIQKVITFNWYKC